MTSIGRLTKFAFIFVLIYLFASGGYARAEDPFDLKKEMEELKKRVSELEDARVLHDKEEKERESIGSLLGKNLGAFGDVNWTTDNREGRNGFYLGSLGLYSAVTYKERLSFLFEAVLVSHNNRSSIALERLWVSYAFSDYLVIRGGRFHSALGYWNLAYHHAKHLFPTVDRPFFIKFEDIGGVVPIHIVGLEMSGTASLNGKKLKYWLEYGNGPTIMTDRHSPPEWKLIPNTAFDDNASKQVAARLTVEAVKGGTFGISFTDFKLDHTQGLPSVIDLHLDQQIYGLDGYYKKGNLELIGEYFFFKNRYEDGSAYYIQMAYAVGDFTPYLRYERLSGNSSDPYLGTLSGGDSRFQQIAGLRYDIDALRSGVKAQFRYDDKEGDEAIDVYELQWTFYF